ncbi:MAG: PQQ-dependent sugar dehydrogenase [Acidimicrobiales bacterium]|nr:PQQ-dependent sugar dehydrogenase [Acidimicrobiales bacterium]
MSDLVPGSPPEDERERVRWPLVAKLGVGLAVLTLLVGIGAALIAAFVVDRSDEPTVIISASGDPLSPVALAEGGFLYAERTTGRIMRSDRTGETTVAVELSDELATEGQRGLLSLATRQSGEATDVYASWTRASDGRLVVGRLASGTETLVWEGPVSTELANGGTLAFRGDELLISIGDLQEPDATDDPDTPNGKILVLDPDGEPDQEPWVVSGGWNNPFAMTVVDDDIWLVDNAPGPQPERVVRISPEGEEAVLELDGEMRAPSSLAVLPDGDLVLCGFLSEVVERLPTPDAGVALPGEVLGPPCATGVTVLADGSIVTTTSDAVWRDPDHG